LAEREDVYEFRGCGRQHLEGVGCIEVKGRREEAGMVEREIKKH
jgi:hypothetical protein